MIAFSGGRTSAFLLKTILDQCKGEFPSDWHVVFANTGKEFDETLEFVQECSERWNVKITWVEYRPKPMKFAIVDFKSASRNGEPFKTLIDERKYLPNPVTRICTAGLKIIPMQDYALSLGWKHWDCYIAFRWDEQNRIEKLRKRNSRERWNCLFPLSGLKVERKHVDSFWNKQPFRLRIPAYKGNCDLCYFKGVNKINAILRDEPERAEWWIAQEWRTGATFRIDRPPYKMILEKLNTQQELDFGLFDDQTSCGSFMCTD